MAAYRRNSTGPRTIAGLDAEYKVVEHQIARSRVPSPFELPQPGNFIAQLLGQRRLHFKAVAIAGSSHGRHGPVRFSRMNVRLRRESHFDPKSGRRFGVPHHA
jgi:hypothetical protein